MKPRFTLALPLLLLILSGRLACAQGTGPVLQQQGDASVTASIGTIQQTGGSAQTN